jgi:uncharacterized membrane protein HdeD (DUF308 family)
MDEDPDGEPPPIVLLMLNGWQATLMLGLVTLVFGVIVTAHPDDSVHVLVILVGIAVIVSGIFHLVRTLDRGAEHRLWLGFSGLAFIVIGLVLIRYLHLTIAVVALLIGLAWIVQGAAGVMSAASRSREGALWWGVFGVVSLIAGIVVIAVPEKSVTVLAVVIGIWMLVIGLLEIVAALVLQHAASSGGPTAGGPPPAWTADVADP